MISSMLKPIFKRFWGLFASMAFVSLLSIGLLCSFASAIINLQDTYTSYVADYLDIDGQFTTDFSGRVSLESSGDFSALTEVEGVECYDARLALDTLLEKDDGRKITARVFSYDEANDTICKRHVIDSVPKTQEEGYYNVSVSSKFSANNDFIPGSSFKIGFFGIFINCYVAEVVETPEGIYPRTNDYIWSDNHDFGYIYADIDSINAAIFDLAGQVQRKVNEDPSFLPEYRAYIEAAGYLIPDLSTLADAGNFASLFFNQLLVKAKSGYTQQQVVDNVSAYLEQRYVNVKSASIADNLPYRLYMQNVLKQLSVATIFLPVFFYIVTMIVIGLFVNQIIKTMTPEIGVLMSIGIEKKQIISIYLFFVGLMAVVAGVLGIVAGLGLDGLLVSIMVKTYSISLLPVSVNPWVAGFGILALVIFAELATFLSCLSIFRITPKDATINNESKRRKLPKWLDRFIDKAPMNIKLSTNSIAQNPRRFAVSSFSIFASYVLILLTCFFFVSKEAMISQTVGDRLSYDCEVYLAARDDILAQRVESYTDAVEAVDECYYTYVKATSETEKEGIYLECLAIPMDSTLVHIPDERGNGRLNIQESGIVLPLSDANRLGVSKGSDIVINGQTVAVTDISYQYFHPTAYLSKAEMIRIGGPFVTSLLVDVIDEKAFADHLSQDSIQCLTVFTTSLAKDLYGIFDSINIFIFIMVLFSLGMAFTILCIMSQNALLETKRQVSVFRAIGFTIGNISNMWTFTSVLQVLMASILAVPAGTGIAILLFHLCSSSSQIYPFLFDWRVVLLGLAFILVVVVACHAVSMITIRRWNLADNLRCRE